MPYSYKHLDEFFSLSSWDDDLKGAFGLVPPPGNWANFKSRIEELKAQCRPGESIKVIFAARHGQAEHNTLAKRYNIDIDLAQILYPILDSGLTALGREQARTLRSALRRETERGMPVPERWFVSPLKRPGETCGIEWGWLAGSDRDGENGEDDVDERVEKGEEDLGHGVPAIVVENLREHLHVHLCDSRSRLSYLKGKFPSFTYPASMSEEDELWQPGSVRGRETEEELVSRLARAIEDVFNQSRDVIYISITAHSGALRGLYSTLGVPARELDVGEMNVLVIRVQESPSDPDPEPGNGLQPP